MKTMRNLKKLFAVALMVPGLALAAASVALDRAPNVSGDNAALQNGARLYVNYCQSCHGLSGVRYNKLMDLGLTKEQILGNLMFTTDKIGEQMTTALRPADGRRWFGVTPPDLSLIARARASADGSGADWLYTYLRSFYRDHNRPTGWNNKIFENVGMPHVLTGLQGEQVIDADHQLTLAVPGQLSADDYDKQVGDLVGFLTWAAEPHAQLRQQLGVGVLIFLGVLFVLAYMLKKEYWKDVH